MMAVEMMPVRSSNIASVGHDPETMELHVTFHSGQTYVYSGVDAAAAQDLTTNPSPGSYFARWVKGKYPYRQE